MGRWILHNLFIILVLGSSAQCWSNKAHQDINRAAAQIITENFGDFVRYFNDSLAFHAVDPDLWKQFDPDEGYRHYIDVDLYTSYPFSDLPPAQTQLISKYGKDNVAKWGIGPYYIEEYSENIIDMMKSGAWDAILIPMAALGHYVADIHMPLHVVANYNGQFTGNDGIHFRWEVSMVDALVDTVIPAGPVYEFNDIFIEGLMIVRESFSVHQQILQADSLARAAQTPEVQELLSGYTQLPDSSDYLEILFRESGELARTRLNQAAQRVASFWYYCWLKAGRPSPVFSE